METLVAEFFWYLNGVRYEVQMHVSCLERDVENTKVDLMGVVRRINHGLGSPLGDRVIRFIAEKLRPSMGGHPGFRDISSLSKVPEILERSYRASLLAAVLS